MIYPWPHAHLAHSFAGQAIGATDALSNVFTTLPRERTYPLLVVQSAGIGPLGADYTIQADQPRLQVDSWAPTKQGAEKIAGQVFRLWDKRFGGLQDVRLLVEDDAHPGDYFETFVEWVGRNSGGDAYFDEIAKVWRVTAFYLVKVNL